MKQIDPLAKASYSRLVLGLSCVLRYKSTAAQDSAGLLFVSKVLIFQL